MKKNLMIVAVLVAAFFAENLNAGISRHVPASIKAKYASVLSSSCDGGQDGLPYLSADQSAAYARAVNDLLPYYDREVARCYALRYAESVN